MRDKNYYSHLKLSAEFILADFIVFMLTVQAVNNKRKDQDSGNPNLKIALFSIVTNPALKNLIRSKASLFGQLAILIIVILTSQARVENSDSKKTITFSATQAEECFLCDGLEDDDFFSNDDFHNSDNSTFSKDDVAEHSPKRNTFPDGARSRTTSLIISVTFLRI